MSLRFAIKSSISLLLILFFLISCNSKQKVKSSINSEYKVVKDIDFDFSAKSTKKINEGIEIQATLFNNSFDTIYFLSTSCDGEQNSLQYDSSKFVLTSTIDCEVDIPKIIKILPKQVHNFKAYFKNQNNETKIRLGFELYLVEKSFDLSKLDLSKIHSRKREQQNIIWAKYKFIN